MAGTDVRELLYDGETVEHEVSFGAGRVVVTSHRVLAVTPNAPGANVRKADRPNVENVAVATDSKRRHLLYAVAMVVMAVPFIAGGRFLSFDGMFEGVDTATGSRAIGVNTGFIDTLGYVFGLIDDALLWTGVVCLALVLVFLVLYVRSRTTVLRIHLAGARNVSIPAGNTPDVDSAVGELRGALGFGSAPESVGGGSDPDEETAGGDRSFADEEFGS